MEKKRRAHVYGMTACMCVLAHGQQNGQPYNITSTTNGVLKPTRVSYNNKIYWHHIITHLFGASDEKNVGRI